MLNNTPNQNDNDIINKLIENQTPSDSDKSANDQISVSTARISSIKYRFYVILLLGLILVWVFNYLIPSWEKTKWLQATIQNKNQEINNFLKKKQQYEKDKDLIGLIENKENTIISCVNYKIWCSEIPEEIRDNFWFARSYLNLNNLYDPKMEINEKIILANINEYLLKDLNQKNSSRIGKVTTISLGDPEVVVSQLYSIPIKLEASFENKNKLLTFIENVDKNVLENKTYRILYKIDEINYNIMNYNEEQTVSIKMNAFYYKE